MRLDPGAEDFYAYAAGDALVGMGRYEEGVTVLRRHLAAYPDNLVAHLFLVIASAELGRDQDARAEGAEITRISPHFALASVLGSKNVTLHKNWETDFRKAGLK
jgi:hypothetical protein